MDSQYTHDYIIMLYRNLKIFMLQFLSFVNHLMHSVGAYILLLFQQKLFSLLFSLLTELQIYFNHKIFQYIHVRRERGRRKRGNKLKEPQARENKHSSIAAQSSYSVPVMLSG